MAETLDLLGVALYMSGDLNGVYLWLDLSD